MALTSGQAKTRINRIIKGYGARRNLLGRRLTGGKLYEAWILAEVLDSLRIHESLAPAFVGSNMLTLKSSPGPINASYPHFVLMKGSVKEFEVWTDVEFIGQTFTLNPSAPALMPGHYHELDIVVVPAGVTGRPHHDQVAIGVECKNTSFQKHMVRAALGVRRELSMYVGPSSTPFTMWPSATVEAFPPSVLLVYSTDSKILNYSASGDVFSIDFRHNTI
ncbi:hypothetical protein [Paractinoplanes hotanensis]|uniref:Restriction endonuclease n=1 Tax=Paractinoplanes hotanensis TaxID=2906497 RepID=A0ABT0YF53_9ACTN|nr:hypothetical protein [Actinoplanes hotanensis]MCM4083899.1 hypothetical protein [Actinoplanes hotanensis]